MLFETFAWLLLYADRLLLLSDVPVIYPFFNRTSFVSYPAPDKTLFAMNIYLEFKPQTLSDGIILYEGNDRDGTGDFMSLVQKDGYLEFRFDTGSGKFHILLKLLEVNSEWRTVVST